jgi:hypothetical protein
MHHKVVVTTPVWCKWCECTTELSFMLMGNNIGPTLNHSSCGRIMSELTMRELSVLRSLQRVDVLGLLIERANYHRPNYSKGWCPWLAWHNPVQGPGRA